MINRHQPALWIHGHVHDNFDYRVGATRIENVAFDVGKVVEV